MLDSTSICYGREPLTETGDLSTPLLRHHNV